MIIARRAVLAGAGASLLAPRAFAQPVMGAERFANAFAYAAARRGRATLIMRHGVVIGETVERGALRGESAPIGAATRVLIPLLAAALSHREIWSLDDLVAQSVEGWAADPWKQRITVRQLAAMTSGIALGEAPGAAPHAQEALRAQPVAEPGTRFIDDPAPIQIFVEVARRKLAAARRDADVAMFLRDAVFDRIGAPVGLQRDQDGAPVLATGARAPLSGLAALGELIRRGGLHRGEAILSSGVLREARLGSAVEPRHGLGLWLGGPLRPPGGDGLDLAALDGGVPSDVFGVGGADGTRLYVIPSEALVVAQRAEGQAQDWSDAAFLRAILVGI